jgi:hypothetical protein
MSAIQEELEGAKAGAAAIATELASALFVTIVRIHLEGASTFHIHRIAGAPAGRGKYWPPLCHRFTMATASTHYNSAVALQRP